MNPIKHFTGEYAFLSNFYASPVEFDGGVYPTVEHAYQAAKTLNVDDRIRLLPLTAGQAKRAGRSLTLRMDWEKIKVNVMFTLVHKKFRNPELAAMLAATSGRPLIEGNNWHDNFWGVCYCGSDSCKRKPGENFLGQILEGVRYANEVMV